MYIAKDSIDNLLRELLPIILKEGRLVEGSTKGHNKELFGVLLELTDPRARVSRSEGKGKIFSCIGELLWYLKGDNSLDFINYYIPKYNQYSDDNVTVYGGYGPRLISGDKENDQLRNVIELLKRKDDSRKAVIQLFKSVDILKPRKDVPCTCTLQFVVRDNLVDLMVHMRSNDAFVGLPHDMFCFTMIQEIVARAIGKDIGTYKHSIGSLHIYNDQIANVEAFLSEGIFKPISMEKMPEGCQLSNIEKVLEVESIVRNGGNVSYENLELDSYWVDFIYLLEIFYNFKSRNELDKEKVKKIMLELLKEMNSSSFEVFVKDKIEAL